MTKKTSKTSTTKKVTAKANPKKAPAKKTPRKTASAARAEGVARTKRAQQAKPAPHDHEVPSPKEVANDANIEAYAKGKASTTPAKAAAKRRKQDGGKDPVAQIASKADRMSGLDFAAKVLSDAGEPLAAKAIAERAIAAGWTTSGKTPHATLYAAIIREISKKGDAARFKKTDRGLFVAADTKGGR
jgi:hypothetical protein